MDDRASPSPRRRAVLAGHTADEETARSLLADPDGRVRASALGALERMGRLGDDDVSRAISDPGPEVRVRACELAARRLRIDLATALVDPDWRVVESAAWAAGEREGAGAPLVEVLSTIATGHDEPLCREAAVAALGAIGHPGGRHAILAATTDRPAVRRRAVIALAPFDGPDVEAALRRALADRDWQVRQAAEDLSGD